jgi:uncharacterized membrane protein YfcA
MIIFSVLFIIAYYYMVFRMYLSRKNKKKALKNKWNEFNF